MRTQSGFARLRWLAVAAGVAAGGVGLASSVRLACTRSRRVAPRVAGLQRKDIGHLQVILTRLVTGVGWWDPHRAPHGEEPWASQAEFEILESGRPAPWEPVKINVTDAKSESWHWSGGGNVRHSSAIAHTFFLEPADYDRTRRPAPGKWKLVAELSRTSGYDAQELWTVRGVPVPRKGAEGHFRVVASAVRKGTKVDLEELAPPRADLGEQILGPVPYPSATVKLRPKRPGLRLAFVNATDDHGRNVKTSLLMSGSGSDVVPNHDRSYRYHFGLVDLRKDARTVDLTFAVHKSVFVEFEATPIVPH